MTKNIILITIILGLVINLLANMIWKYLPETSKRLDLTITVILIIICVLILLMPYIKKHIYFFSRYSDKIALFVLIIVCIILAFYAYHEKKQYGQPKIGKYKSEFLDLNGNGQLDAGEPYWILPPGQGSAPPNSDEKLK